VLELPRHAERHGEIVWAGEDAVEPFDGADCRDQLELVGALEHGEEHGALASRRPVPWGQRSADRAGARGRPPRSPGPRQQTRCAAPRSRPRRRPQPSRSQPRNSQTCVRGRTCRRPADRRQGREVGHRHRTTPEVEHDGIEARPAKRRHELRSRPRIRVASTPPSCRRAAKLAGPAASQLRG